MGWVSIEETPPLNHMYLKSHRRPKSHMLLSSHTLLSSHMLLPSHRPLRIHILVEGRVAPRPMLLGQDMEHILAPTHILPFPLEDWDTLVVQGVEGSVVAGLGLYFGMVGHG